MFVGSSDNTLSVWSIPSLSLCGRFNITGMPNAVVTFEDKVCFVSILDFVSCWS